MTDDQKTSDGEPLEIERIELLGLFRQYDHIIPLQREDRVTILHGRNGVGKTVTLSLIAALLEGNWTELRTVPFTKLRIEFTNGSYLEAVKLQDAVGVWGRVGQGPPTQIWDSVKSDPRDFTPKPLPWPSMKVPVHIIGTQRLIDSDSDSDNEPFGTLLGIQLGRKSPKDKAMVNVLAAEMGKRIHRSEAAYLNVSASLDRDLPARLFRRKTVQAAIDPVETCRRAELQNHESERLHRLGLLGAATRFDTEGLEPAQLAQLHTYLQDNEKKLAVFKELADRAEILLDILNRKLAPKQVQLDRDAGYQVKTHDGQKLKLGQLSSGEQHELVLLHSLLFRVTRGALLLIDEPELSLHVTWQTEFLEDLIRIAKQVGFSAVLATHSPYIVGKREDLMVRLRAPV